MSIQILYEDSELLIINKPFGVVVNRAESVKESTVQDWAEKELGIKNNELRIKENNQVIAGDFYNRAGIVHRLDKETSGCLIIAKTPASFNNLQAAFKARLVKKTYRALVHGKLVPEEGEIRAPVGRLPWNRERFGVIPGGKEAATRYKRITYHISRITNEQYTLVEVYPETGRTHQIRVHLKYINYPIVGDYLYAGRKTQRDDRKWCPRVFLHAAKIEFPHPTTGKIIVVEAFLPHELQLVLASLGS